MSQVRVADMSDFAFESVTLPPINLLFTTLTGVDQHCDFQRIADLSTQFPFAEWAFCFGYPVTSPGNIPPSAFEWPLAILDPSSDSSLPAHVNVAVHFHGQAVPDLLFGNRDVLKVFDLIKARGGRVQLNHNFSVSPIPHLAVLSFIHEHKDTVFITQTNQNNAEMTSAIYGIPNHSVIVDDCAAAGGLPQQWASGQAYPRIGYTGGLGPDNISSQLPLIAQAANNHAVWIEVGSSLRTNQLLDLDKCESVLSQVGAFLTATRTS